MAMRARKQAEPTKKRRMMRKKGKSMKKRSMRKRK